MFFDALNEAVTKQYNIDPNRIYLTGMSNGAYFISLLASQRSEKIAAIAPHSGGLSVLGLAKDPAWACKYGVIVVHGERDSVVKVDEGRKMRDACLKWGHQVEYVEVPDHHHFWANSIKINDKIWDFFESHPRQVVKP